MKPRLLVGIIFCLLMMLTAVPILWAQSKVTSPPPKPRPPVIRNNTLPVPNAPPLELVFVYGGTFAMGDQWGFGDGDEKPLHTVTVSDFYLGKYEVTNAQFAAFLNARGNQSEGGAAWFSLKCYGSMIEQRGGRFVPKSGYEQHPVVCVTWYGARAFAQWVGGRLPTEAEWEYAARAGGQRIMHTHGNDVTHEDDGNYYGTKGRDQWSGTSPVGSFAPNGLGLYDMEGNAFEWCADWYDENYYRSSPRANPQGPSSGQLRVLRGGSWGTPHRVSRTVRRGKEGPDFARDVCGFRVGVAPPSTVVE